jgi:hypothetical protein
MGEIIQNPEIREPVTEDPNTQTRTQIADTIESRLEKIIRDVEIQKNEVEAQKEALKTQKDEMKDTSQLVRLGFIVILLTTAAMVVGVLTAILISMWQTKQQDTAPRGGGNPYFNERIKNYHR